MLALFWIAAMVAIVSTMMVITRRNAIHALLYLIVSLLSVAMVFMLLGAPFVAMLEVIVYAGAIMVLFVFVVMLLNLGPQAIEQESHWLRGKIWVGPVLLASVLLLELAYCVTTGVLGSAKGAVLADGSLLAEIDAVGPKEVAITLFGPYLIGVELAGMILLAGLVGAFHIGRPDGRKQEEVT